MDFLDGTVLAPFERNDLEHLWARFSNRIDSQLHEGSESHAHVGTGLTTAEILMQSNLRV